MAPGTASEDDSETTYLVQRKICRGMICTFVLSLIIITCVSLWFFVHFINQTLEMSIENMFLSHTHSMV